MTMNERLPPPQPPSVALSVSHNSASPRGASVYVPSSPPPHAATLLALPMEISCQSPRLAYRKA